MFNNHSRNAMQSRGMNKERTKMYSYYGIYSSQHINNGKEYLDTAPRACLDEIYLICGTDEKVVDILSFDNDDLEQCKQVACIIAKRFGRDILDYIDFGNLNVNEALAD